MVHIGLQRPVGRKEPKIPDAILNHLLAGADPKTAFDPNGLLDALKKARRGISGLL
jgi:putative transposase